MTTTSRFVGCLALTALGCVELRYPDAGEDAAIDAPMAPDSPDSPDAPDAPDVADALDAADVRDVMDVVDAPDVGVDAMGAEGFDSSDGADATDVADVTDATNAADVRDVMDAADVRDAVDVADARDVIDVMDVMDVTSMRDVADAARDVAPFWGMLRLTYATATFSQAGYGVSHAINGQTTEGQGWGIAPSGPAAVEAQTAAFEFESTTPFSATGTRVVVTLINYSIGFRLAYFGLLLTNSPRDTFADGRETTINPGGTAIWIDPTIASVEATNSVRIAVVAQRILTDESFVRSTYTITLETSASQFTGIRLDALRNTALTSGGPGTATGTNTGNFSLTEIQVSASPR